MLSRPPLPVTFTMPDEIRLSDVLRALPSLVERAPGVARGLHKLLRNRFRSGNTLASFSQRHADCRPDAVAVIDENRSICWGELNRMADDWAGIFRDQGIRPGDTVAVCLQNRCELMVLITALHKIGAAAAMLNTSQRGEALRHSLALVRPAAIVWGDEQREARDSLEDIASDGPARSHSDTAVPPRIFTLAEPVPVPGQAPGPAGRTSRPASQPGSAAQSATESGWTLHPDTPADPTADIDLLQEARCRAGAGQSRSLTEPVDPEARAFYLYTSGTTGLPKAAPCSHDKWLKAGVGMGDAILGLSASDTLYVPLPLYHGTGLLAGWGAALATGATLAIRRRFSATAFWPDVVRTRATGFLYVGEICRYLLNQPATQEERQHRLRVMAGNGLRPALWGPFKARFQVPVIRELYAASEGNAGFINLLNLPGTVGITAAPHALVQHEPGSREPLRDSAGRVLPVAAGAPGLLLLQITTTWQFEGYSQPEETEKVIVRNAFERGDAWFNTGDVLRCLGWGHMQFVDRLGDTFRWKGENVSCAEVEQTFDRSGYFPEACVYGVIVPGHEGRAPMAAVTTPASPHTGQAPGPLPDDLLQTLSTALPDYAIPVFIRVTHTLPRTPTHKYQKSGLQTAAYHPVDRPDPGQPVDELWYRPRGASRYQRLDARTAADIEQGRASL